MLIADVPGVVVVPSKLPIKNIQELVAYAKSHSGEMNYGSPGYGKGTPPDAIQALAKAIEDTLKDEEIKRVLFKLGIEAMPGSASVLRERVSSDSRRWEKVIKNRKMELQ
jgi:tripartite-type tricarboxylate transporter receptor subunit TctC